MEEKDLEYQRDLVTLYKDINASLNTLQIALRKIENLVSEPFTDFIRTCIKVPSDCLNFSTGNNHSPSIILRLEGIGDIHIKQNIIDKDLSYKFLVETNPFKYQTGKLPYNYKEFMDVNSLKDYLLSLQKR